MAATAVTTKIAVNMKLNNGVTTTGSVKTLSVSLGKINKDAFDLDKAAAISALVEACLTKSVYTLEKAEYSKIMNG